MTVSSRLLWGKRESGLTPPWAVKPFQCSTRAYPVDARGVGGSVLQGYSCSTSDAMMLMLGASMPAPPWGIQSWVLDAIKAGGDRFSSVCGGVEPLASALRGATPRPAVFHSPPTQGTTNG